MGAILIIPIAAALALSLRRRIEETVSPAAVLIIFVLYCSGLSGSFLPGYYLCLALIVVSVPASVFLILRERKNDAAALTLSLRRLLTPGLAAYIVFFVVFFLFNRQRYYIHSTDFFHWGIAARDFFRNNAYSNIAAASDMFPGTPPATTLWIWFSMRIKGAYDTSTAFWAQEMLQASVVLPLFTVIRSRADLKKGAVLFLTLLLLPMMASERYAYSTLSPVFLIGMTAAMLLRTTRTLLIRRDSGDLICVAAASFLLCCSGYGGLTVSIILFLLTLIASVAEVRRYGEVLRPRLITCLTLFVPTAFLLITRTIYLSVTGKVNNMSVASMLEEARIPIDGPQNPLKTLLFVLGGISDRNLSGTIGHVLPLSFLSLCVIMLTALLACRILRGRFPALPAISGRYISYSATGILLYLVSLWGMYYFLVPAARADELAYFELALIPATVFLLTRLVMRLIALSVTRDKIQSVIWSVLFWCGLLSVNIGSLMLLAIEQPQEAPDYALDFAYEQGFQFFPDDKIYYIDRPDTLLYVDYRSYMEVSEARIGALYYRLTKDTQIQINLSGQDLRHWEVNTRVEDTLHEVNNRLMGEGYRYVYLENRGLSFTDHYAPLFVDTQSLEKGKFFGVTVYEDGTVQLLTISRAEEVSDWVR